MICGAIPLGCGCCSLRAWLCTLPPPGLGLGGRPGCLAGSPLGCCSRAGADSASSSLTKLEFGAGERRCHWADWVEVDESRGPGSAPSPASSPPSAPPGLSPPAAQPWEVPRAGWSNWSVVPRLSQTVGALHLTKVGQGSRGPGPSPWGPRKMSRSCQHHPVLFL